MTKRFLTYEQLDSMIASGVNVTLAESGRVLVVWSTVNHGSMYAWNGLAQSFQFVRGAFRSDKIVAFGWVLYRCHAITDVSTMISYMEKPWKWQREYDAYRELGGTTDEVTINAMARRFGA